MKKLIAVVILALTGTMSAFAHQSFTLVSREKKTVKQTDIAAAEKGQTVGTKDKKTLTFTEKEIRLVVTTGPEDDMLSFWIQGMRNPTLVVPPAATLKILFVNVDTDMRHDVRFGHVEGEFTLAPELDKTAGSTKLTSKSEDDVMQAEEVVIRSTENGLYK